MSISQTGLGEDGRPESDVAEVAAAPAEVAAAEEAGGPAAEEPSAAAESADGEAPAASDEGPSRELAVKVELLAQSVEEANRLAGERERIIDRLHQENQRLRQGELQQAVLPIFRDLVRLYDDLRETARAYASRAEVKPPEAARDFELFAEMVTDILYRQGVERYEAREGEPFSSKDHRALGAIQTPEQDKDRTIARGVRDGFRSETRVIRLLEAEVYRYAPAAAPADGGGPAGDAG